MKTDFISVPSVKIRPTRMLPQRVVFLDSTIRDFDLHLPFQATLKSLLPSTTIAYSNSWMDETDFGSLAQKNCTSIQPWQVDNKPNFNKMLEIDMPNYVHYFLCRNAASDGRID